MKPDSLPDSEPVASGSATGTSTVSRSPRRPRRRPRRRLALWLFSALAVCVIACAVAAGLVLRPATVERSDPWLRVPAGATDGQVRDSLRAVLGDARGDMTWRLWKGWKGTPARSHGAYRINPEMSLLKLVREVAHGRQTPVRVIFRDLRTIDALANRLSAQVDLPADSILAAMRRVLPPRGFSAPEQYPAAFMPDTYEFYWSVSADRLVSTLADSRDRFWNDDRRRQAKALGLTPVQLATIASIAEEETASRDERGVVGQLYINRLRRGMLLQADPTVKFAVGDFGLRRILGSHLRVNSPYNTYQHPGLPPGPIRIVEGRTIDAILQAAPHSYLYMCARPDGSGTHAFATDYDTHLRNARAYRSHLDSRGIR